MPTTVLLSKLNQYQRKQYKRERHILKPGIRLWLKKGGETTYLHFGFNGQKYVLFHFHYTGKEDYHSFTLWNEKREYMAVARVRFKEGV